MRRSIITAACISLAFSVYAQDELDGLLRIAGENNSGLAAQEAAVEAVKSRSGRAGAWEDPRLSAGYFIQPIETRTGPQRWRFSLSQMFPWFGTAGTERDLYTQLSGIEYLSWLDQREKLFRDLRQDYYSLWSLRGQISINERMDDVLANLEELAETRISSGTGRLSDYNRIRISRQEVRNELLTLREEYDSRYRSLQEKVQVPFDTLKFEKEFEIKVTGRNIPDSIPGSPGFLLFQARAEASRLEKEVIRQKARPNIGAGIDYVIVDKRSDMAVPDNGRNALMPMVTVSLPIWRRKVNSALEEADWRSKQYEEASEQYLADRKAELEMTLFEMDKALKTLSLADDQLGLLEDTQELVETEFANDNADLRDLLLIQEDILNYEKRRIKAIEAYLLSQAKFNYLTWETIGLPLNNTEK